jgi:hypothetical protein
MAQALKNYAEVYGAFLSTITVGGSKEVALAYAVKDMMNQVKGMSEEAAAYLINDEADYLLTKMNKVAA